MELMKQNFFPESVCFSQIVGKSFLFCQSTPCFHLSHRKLASAVVLFYHSLRGVSSSVCTEVKFAYISMFRAALFFHILKELLRAFHFYLSAAFQVFLAFCIFDVVSGRTAAAVTVAKRQKECIQILFLCTIFPYVVNFIRLCPISIAGGQERNHLCSVHTFPGEIMIRELFPFVIGPENFLCYQIFYTTALKNLRQCCRVTKCVRKPQNFTVYSQHILIVAFSVNQLTHQCFSAGHVRIGFYPHSSVSNPLSAFNCFQNTLEKFRIIFSAHLIGSRLTLNKFIFRIFLNETKLRCKSTLRLSVCFCHRPQPCQIQMCVSYCIEYRHCGTVYCFHNRF